MMHAHERQVHLAIDIGAESGRVIAGIWEGATIRLEEVHRFPNGPVQAAGTLRWNILKLWDEIQIGLTRAAKKFGNRIISVGVDTWAVDFVLLDKRGEMLEQPYHYRDSRTNGMMARAFKTVPRAELFAQTGLQFLQFNTLFQLLALKATDPGLLARADRLLMIPDFIHFRLCGSRVAEFTNATTTQCLDPRKRGWAKRMLKGFDLPEKIFPKIVSPGTRLGKLIPSVAQRTGLGRIQVVAPPTHDTASAVAAVPTADTGKLNWAYISSGTWSLVGVESPVPQLSLRALRLNVTNEGGVDDTWRVLKNVMGLWLVQQCKRSFDARGKRFSYAQLVKLAEAAGPSRSLVNPDDARFLNPPDMPGAIQDFCRETGQPVPKSAGGLIRCALESLAVKYAGTLRGIEKLTGEKIGVVHIVGGGSQNVLLNQLTADASGRTVIAGPVEATALGNLLTQVRAHGEIGSLAELRAVVRSSSGLREFSPGKPLKV
jgi:rhamnulokinase